MKRGESGLSLLIGVDKGASQTSHDVVDIVRGIFGEKRVGHAGTLDPMASGVLPIMVGPAAKLDRYLTGQDKTYVARIVLGRSTTTDDSEGQTLHSATVPRHLLDPDFIQGYLDAMIGEKMQLPPAFSAVKVNGRRSYEAARHGNIISLKPRKIEIRSARLTGCGVDAEPYWDVELSVSKGTYIRAIARDIGADLKCFAHIGALRRIRSGNISIEECMTLDAVRRERQKAAIDPVRALGLRFAFVGEDLSRRIENGGSACASEVKVFAYGKKATHDSCGCTSDVLESRYPLEDGEILQLVHDNRLCALCRFHEEIDALKPECVFQTSVSRGSVI